MPVAVVIPATIASSSSAYSRSAISAEEPNAAQSRGARASANASYASYGSTTPTSNGGTVAGPRKGKEPASPEDSTFVDSPVEYLEEIDEEPPMLDVTWRYMSRLYMLVPVVTLFWLALLFLLITFAWPPDKDERKGGQNYPHEFLWKPFLIGIFASCTVQVMRVPIYVVLSAFPFSTPLITLLSSILHTALHELARISTLPIIVPSPISGFHSSFYLGLGWGAAEAAWGIVQGWDQLALYEDIMLPDPSSPWAPVSKRPEESALLGGENGSSFAGESSISRLERLEAEIDEADLERKVEVLERMRARRDLEEIIGVPFPTIPIALHLLWRLDTLLLNLGLTLILSAFYYDSAPIYQHLPSGYYVPDHGHGDHADRGAHAPGRYLWAAWGVVTGIHICVSLVWKFVGRVGVGAVTFGGLIVALGTVFAGLGTWGGVV